MGIKRKDLHASITELARREPAFQRAIDRVGLPDERVREGGYSTLLRTIVGQQVSTAAAASVWNKLEAAMGTNCPPPVMLKASDEELRACGLSRQKAGYARSLAGLVESGELNLIALPADDEEAIAALTAVKGIGRWSAEIYLLFAEGRPDVWPAGDLAVQIEVGRIMGLPDRPDEKTVRAIAENWRPHRGAAAIMAWHHYNTKMDVI